MSFKGIVHPNILILSLITLVAIVYLHNTNEDILMKSESFLDSNTTNTFKAQKGIVKNIKIIYLWFNSNVMKLREYFLCTKKTK